MNAGHISARNPSSPVSRVVSVPFRTGPLPWSDEIARVGWKADTEIELRERCERSSILRHGQTATRTRSSGSAHASCRLNDEPHDQSGDDEQHQCAHSRSRSPVTRGTWLANRATGCPMPRQGLPQSESSSTCVLNALGHGLARVIPPPHHHERRNDGDARENGPAQERIHIPCDAYDERGQHPEHGKDEFD